MLSRRRRLRATGVAGSTVLAVALLAGNAVAQLVQAEPSGPIVASIPAGVPAVETQVVVEVVVDATGTVESAIETSRVPSSAPDSLARAAVEAVRAARFRPSTRDGRPIRSRVEYIAAVSRPTYSVVVSVSVASGTVVGPPLATPSP